MTELRQLECERGEAILPALPASPSAALATPPRRSGRITGRDQLLDALRRTGWNKAEVARILGVARTTVWRKMRAWNIPMEGPADGEVGEAPPNE